MSFILSDFILDKELYLNKQRESIAGGHFHAQTNYSPYLNFAGTQAKLFNFRAGCCRPFFSLADNIVQRI